MPTGKVKWYDAEKGFGFIMPDEGGPDVFVHQTEIQTGQSNLLEEGQSVQYQVKATPKGIVALSVTLVNS